MVETSPNLQQTRETEKLNQTTDFLLLLSKERTTRFELILGQRNNETKGHPKITNVHVHPAPNCDYILFTQDFREALFLMERRHTTHRTMQTTEAFRPLGMNRE